MGFLRIYLLIILANLLVIPASYAQALTDESYETILTKHITLHQEYPTSGKLYGLEGDIIIRVQVDRDGNLVSHVIVHKSNHPVLNKAVDDMIAKANPAPKPPANYFEDGQQVAEFMLPIAFRSKKNANNLKEIDSLFQEKSRQAHK